MLVAELLKVIDGDTVKVRISLGFNVSVEINARLDGINCAERNTEKGKATKEWLTSYVAVGSRMTVESVKPYAHGSNTWVCMLRVIGSQETLSQALIKAGHALPWDGKGKPPIPQ